jgi:chromosome segregation ATPase
VTLLLWAWLLSIAGAGLFFAAGDVWSRQRRASHEAHALNTLGAEIEATRAHMLEQEHGKQELRAIETKLSGELARTQIELDRLRGELNTAKERADALEHELSAAQTELRKPRTVVSAPPPAAGVKSQPATSSDSSSVARSRALEQELARAKAEREVAQKQLETERSQNQQQRQSDAAQLKSTEQQLLSNSSQLKSLEQQIADNAAQLKASEAKIFELTQRAAPDSQTAALEQELGLTRESLRVRDNQLEQLREDAARLRGVEQDLERARREVSELAEQTRLLRAEAYASNGTPRKRSERPPTISTRGNSLQLIVDTETETGRAKSAVIADELGLVVAASGLVHEYGDALAALGAYLADVGTKTRDVLPLHEVRQVVVRDDHDMTLTVRPLATEDPGLALVTLAVGANTAARMDEPSYLR